VSSGCSVDYEVGQRAGEAGMKTMGEECYAKNGGLSTYLLPIHRLRGSIFQKATGKIGKYHIAALLYVGQDEETL